MSTLQLTSTATHSAVRLAGACLFTLALAATAAAQPSFTVTFGRSFDSLAAAGNEGERRQVTDAEASVEHLFANQRARVFYELDAGTFSTPGDWSYFLHSAGLVYRLDLDKAGHNRLFASGYASWRSNGASWAAADFRAVTSLANVELHPGQHSTLRFGYRFDARRFPDLAELNQNEHNGFVSLLVNLPSRTTLIGEARLGGKSYQATSSVVSEAVSASPSGDSSGVAALGNGRGMGPGLRGTGQPTTLVREPSTRAGQITWLARIAQSLADRTGATMQVSHRGTFGRVPPVVVTTPALFFDDGVYDDPYASEATSWRLSLKHASGRWGEIEGAGYRTSKGYNSTPALGVDGEPQPENPLRQDRIWLGQLAWTLPLFAEHTGPLGLDLNLTYRFVRHESNDAFYNYRSHGLGLGLTVAY